MATMTSNPATNMDRLPLKGIRLDRVEGPEQRRLAGMSKHWTYQVYQADPLLGKKKNGFFGNPAPDHFKLPWQLANSPTRG
jgi:hypothetical protein